MHRANISQATFIPAPYQAQQVSRMLQRACACESGSGSASGAGFSHSFSSLRINQPGDRYEQDAERLAAAVLRGGAGAGLGARLGSAGLLQRDEPKETKKPPSDDEKYKEAAKKVGEAFLKTDVGTKLKNQATEMGEEFLGTLPGKIITGAAAVGAITAIAATNSELPMQVPEIPLDILTPGLSMNLTYEGPVQKPTKAMISFTYTFGAGDKKEKKGAMSEKEKYRAETARMAAEQQKFSEGMKPAGQRAAENQEYWDAFWRMKGKDPMNPLALPGLKKKEDEKSLMMMRKEAGPGGPRLAPPAVGEVLRSSGQPLDPATQTTMERLFGFDFSGVRLHTGPQAEDSARQVNALAYTVGRDVVFGAGQFSPSSAAGSHLLAHELAHVIQQGAARPARPAFEAVQVVRSPQRLARQEDPSAVSGEGGPAEAPSGESAPVEESAPPASVGPASPAEAAPNCAPRALSRRDFLAQTGNRTELFGLTVLEGSRAVAPQLRFAAEGRRVRLEATTATLPEIPSIYTGVGSFVEGSQRLADAGPGSCPGGEYPIRWQITAQGAEKIRQGEQEHCDDFNRAFDLTLGRYRDEINRLAASRRTFASQAAARRALQSTLGFSIDDMPGIFECLAEKSRQRDSDRNRWHTPIPHYSPPMHISRCREITAWVRESSFPHVGRHPAAGLIQGCGEAPSARGSGR